MNFRLCLMLKCAVSIMRVHADVVKGLKQADALDVFTAQGLDQATSTPEELAAMVKTELAKWTTVIKAAGIKAE